jgi:hypothetical protein
MAWRRLRSVRILNATSRPEQAAGSCRMILSRPLPFSDPAELAAAAPVP